MNNHEAAREAANLLVALSKDNHEEVAKAAHGVSRCLNAGCLTALLSLVQTQTCNAEARTLPLPER